MWQDIITYIILAFTFGSVLYKMAIKPMFKLFKGKNYQNKKGNNPICASCNLSISCESCAFYNSHLATYRYMNEIKDSVQVSQTDSKNNDTVPITFSLYKNY